MSERFINAMKLFNVVLTLIVVSTQCLYAQVSDRSSVDLVSKARKSVVSIEASMPLSSRMGVLGKALDKKISATDNRKQKIYVSMGSGVVWNNAGHVVTTKSIVQNSSNILVRGANGQNYQAHVVGIDELSDLAVIQLENYKAEDLVPAKMRTTKLPEGSWLVLMGYGYEGIPTVSPGMAGIPPEDFDPGRHWFQFTASLRPGNSGGALIDSQGQLAGIVLGQEEDIGFNAVIKMLTSKSKNQSSSGKSAYSNFGVGVPLNQAKPIVEQIIREGSVVRGWIGISVRQLTDLTTGDSELIVVRIIPGGPADDAGLKVGDRIRCLNTHEVTSPVHLGRIIRDLHPGNRIPVEFDRNGNHLRSDIMLRERPDKGDLSDTPNTDSSKNLLRDVNVLEDVSVNH